MGNWLIALKPKYKMRQAKALIKNAITALLVKPEQHNPIAEKTAAKKKSPIYEPVIPPVSIPPPADKDCIVNTYIKVGNSEKRITVSMAKYFPKTICQVVNGRVCKISKVPVLNSSESVRIVIAGIKKRRIHGASSKNLSSVA